MKVNAKRFTGSWRRGASPRTALGAAVLALTLPGVAWGQAQAIDYSQSYGDVQRQHRDNYVSGLALGQDPAPNIFQRMGSGISSMWGRVTGKNKKAAGAQDPTALSKDDPLSLWHKTPDPDANFYTKLAELQEQAGNLAGAEQQYQRALQTSAKHVPALLGLARLQDRQGKQAEAAVFYRQAIEADPNDPSPHNDLGLLLARGGDLEGAAQELEQAVELDPSRALFHNNLATVFVDLGRYPEALDELTKAHGDAVGHYNLGYLLAERGQVGPARFHFGEALRRNPQLAEAKQWFELLSRQELAGSAPRSSGAPGAGAMPNANPSAYPPSAAPEEFAGAGPPSAGFAASAPSAPVATEGEAGLDAAEAPTPESWRDYRYPVATPAATARNPHGPRAASRY